MPVTFMLLGLILRGVAFEFRFKADPGKQQMWNICFHVGSVTAAFFQGVILGAFVQGVKIDGRQFAGGTMDWLSPYSAMVGVALIFGYALLGATWLVMKTEGITQDWSRSKTRLLFVMVLIFMGLVTALMPLLDPRIRTLWFSVPNIFYLSPMPLATMALFFLLWRDLKNKAEYRPFFLTLGVFLMNYIGLGISVWPYLVPFEISFRQAAAAPESQTLLLVGIIFFLPLVLLYTGYCYWVFRGKVSSDPMY
jgi:cytochrome d ubiquinol oxidase subunit II